MFSGFGLTLKLQLFNLNQHKKWLKLSKFYRCQLKFNVVVAERQHQVSDRV